MFWDFDLILSHYNWIFGPQTIPLKYVHQTPPAGILEEITFLCMKNCIYNIPERTLPETNIETKHCHV